MMTVFYLLCFWLGLHGQGALLAQTQFLREALTNGATVPFPGIS